MAKQKVAGRNDPPRNKEHMSLKTRKRERTQPDKGNTTRNPGPNHEFPSTLMSLHGLEISLMLYMPSW